MRSHYDKMERLVAFNECNRSLMAMQWRKCGIGVGSGDASDRGGGGIGSGGGIGGDDAYYGFRSLLQL